MNKGSYRPVDSTKCVAALLLLAWTGATAVPADDKVISEPPISTLIQQLGASSFVERDRATQRLLEKGPAAEAALLEAAESTDREVRKRSLQLLNLIRQRQRSARLQQFVAADDQTRGLDLPGWRRFSEQYGANHAAKKIYARMLDSEWELIRSYFAKPESDSNSLAAVRLQRLLGQNGPHQELGTVLTFFFLAAEYAADFQLHHQLLGLVNHPEMAKLLLPQVRRNVADRKIVRKMVGRWIVAANDVQLNHRSALRIALYYQMHDETAVLAKRVLTSQESSPDSKSLAMESIVIRNNRQQIALIEPFLDDATRLGSTGKRVRQLRDVALACMMQLQGHDVGKIGIKPKTNQTYSAFEFGTIGFLTEADREEAFETFRALQASQPPKP